MKVFNFLWIGILFGIIMTKSEAISWFRIQEMFRFQDFHMYGIIGVAVVLGAVFVHLSKRTQFKDIFGKEMTFKPKPDNYKAAIYGGTIFGLGWAMTGACPGPLYTLLGHGYLVVLVIIFSALLGTLAYGALRDKLPH